MEQVEWPANLFESGLRRGRWGTVGMPVSWPQTIQGRGREVMDGDPGVRARLGQETLG